MNIPVVKSKKKKQYIDSNPIESPSDLGKGVAQTLKDDIIEGSISSLWNQLLGNYEHTPSNAKTSGELSAGQEIDFTKKAHQSEQTPRFAIEPGINYRQEIIHGETKITQENASELAYQIHEILNEIKKLISSSKELEIEFKEVVVEQVPQKPSEYHLNFFTWILSLVKIARMKVEDSGAWLQAMRSKKGKKSYWQMFKKHGTTFGLSNERNVATQTG